MAATPAWPRCSRPVGLNSLLLEIARRYAGGMTRAAALKLARYLRSQGYEVRVRHHPAAAPRLRFWTVEVTRP